MLGAVGVWLFIREAGVAGAARGRELSRTSGDKNQRGGVAQNPAAISESSDGSIGPSCQEKHFFQ